MVAHLPVQICTGRCRSASIPWETGNRQHEPDPGVGGGVTRVVMEEHVTAGLGRLIPGPLAARGMDRRNAESLRRLALIAEHRT